MPEGEVTQRLCRVLFVEKDVFVVWCQAHISQLVHDEDLKDFTTEAEEHKTRWRKAVKGKLIGNNSVADAVTTMSKNRGAMAISKLMMKVRPHCCFALHLQSTGLLTVHHLFGYRGISMD